MAIRSAWESSAPAAADRAQQLRAGLPLASFASGGRAPSTRRLSSWSGDWPRHGLLEYRLGRSRSGDSGEDQVVIEPQVPDYWPQAPQLGAADVLVLSRFAYLRRRGNDMVLESPRAGALFRICDPKVAAAVATLSAPQPLKRLRRQDGFPGVELLALLVDCQILFKLDAASDSGAAARPRATTTSCSGTFTIFCSTRAARKAGTPTRWAASIPMPA